MPRTSISIAFSLLSFPYLTWHLLKLHWNWEDTADCLLSISLSLSVYVSFAVLSFFFGCCSRKWKWTPAHCCWSGLCCCFFGFVVVAYVPEHCAHSMQLCSYYVVRLCSLSLSLILAHTHSNRYALADTCQTQQQ